MDFIPQERVGQRLATNDRRPKRQDGYILIALVLVVALLVIGAAAILPSLVQQVKRDREEEMVHRGVQYSRAIRRYVKKFGRYPTRVEELENTNNIRFLRKRYKDPITGKDFKLLHLSDISLNNGPVLGGATLAANMNVSGQAGVAAAGGIARGLSGPSGPATQETSGEDTSQADADKKEDKNAPGGMSITSDNLSSQTFGGGPIVGVASTSKAKTIRMYNKKDHYNDWQFIYDPNSDRGGLIKTPYQPPLSVAAPNVNATTGQPGQSSSPFGAPGGMQGQPAPQPPPQNPPTTDPNQQ